MTSRALEDLRTKRVALVLAGGGFKGAYQIGAWRALWALGVRRFHAIAGTSAGALNAVLIANGDFDAAKHIWRDVEVLRVSPRKLFLLLLGYAILLGPQLIMVPAALCALLLQDAPALWWLSAFLGFLGFFTSFAIYWGYRERAIYLMLNPLDVLLLSSLPLLIALMAIAAEPGGTLAALAGCLLAYPLAAAAVRLIHGGRLAARVLSNKELLDVVRSSLDLQRIRSGLRHLFVTTATKRMLRYPFALNIKPRNAVDGPKYEPDRESPQVIGTWVPQYHDLCDAGDEAAALEALRLSSALPLFLAGSETAAGDSVADGGVADNIPIRPVLESGAEVVVVVVLSADEGRRLASSEGLREYIRRSGEAVYLNGLTYEESSRAYKTYMAQQSDDARRRLEHGFLSWPAGIDSLPVYVLYPRKPLPIVDWWGIRFFTGTLNSSRCARRRWLVQGFVDTFRQLQSDSLEPVRLGASPARGAS